MRNKTNAHTLFVVTLTYKRRYELSKKYNFQPQIQPEFEIRINKYQEATS